MVCARDRDEWRAWLERHHDRSSGTWLVFYKRHTGKPSVSYDDAVEEALCFGWIDSIVRRLDDERYAQKFTPRRPGSAWSQSNRERVEKMIRAGRMTEAGLARFDPTRAAPSRPDPEMPDDFAQALERRPRARRNFEALAPSYRRAYLMWITSARRPETRAKRVRESIALLARNEKLGMR